MPGVNAHHSIVLSAIDRVALAVCAAENTASHAGLSFALFAFRHTMILSTFGISELHSLKASGVQAFRCASVAV